MRKDGKNKSETSQTGAERTALSQTESEQLQSREFWYSVVENMPEIIMTVNRNGIILFINHTVPGMTPEEVIGKCIYDYIQSSHREIMRNSLNRVFQTGIDDKVEIFGSGPRGTTSWYETRVAPIKLEERIVAVSLITTDITERKKTEEALKENEEKYRSLFEEITDAVFVADSETGILTDCNRAATELVGREKEELIGKHQRILHPPQEVEGEFSKSFKQHIMEKDGQVLEAQVITKDGEIKDVAIKASRLDLQGGNRLQGIFRDVTEHKRIDEELKESEQRFRTIFDNAADGILLTDVQTRKLTACNRMFSQMVGYEPDEIKNLGVEDIHPEQDLAYVIGQFEKQVRKEITLAYDTPVKRKDGSVFYADVNSFPITLRGKTYLMGIFRDVTERKAAEEQIRKLTSAVEQSIDGIAIGDLEPRLLYVNDAYARMHGYSREEMAGIPVTKLHNPEQVDRFEWAINHIKTMGSWEGEIGHIRKNGSVFPAYMSVTLLKNDKAQPTGILAVARDITERKKAEETLKIKDTAIASSINAVCITDSDELITYVNNSFLNMWGYEDEKEILDKNYIKFFQTKDKAQKVGEFLRIQGHWIGELTALRKDGSTFDVQLSASAVADNNGKVVSMMATFLDITEHRKAETKLRDSENKYRTLLENLPQRIFLKDTNSVYVSSNENFAKELKIKAEEFTGKTDYDFFPKELAEKYRADDKSIIESGQTKDIEERYVREGQERIVHTVKTPVKDEHGKTTGILGIFWDITERKAAEEQIRKLTSAVEQSIDGIAIADLEPRLLYVNEAYAQMHGYTVEEMIGMPVTKLQNPEQMDIFEWNINKLRTSGSGEDEIKHIKKDGTVFPIYMTVTLLKDSDGEPTGIIVVARDITEAKQREKELDIYREKMVRAEQLASLGTLSATLAHELTQPLTTIRLTIENSLADLQNTSCPDTTLEGLSDGLAEVSSAALIVDRFRSFARQSSDKNVTEVNLKAVGERIIRLLDESARRARLSIHLKGLEKLPTIYCNEKGLEQVFFALVQNAIQATDGKKNHKLVISGVKKDEQVELSFSDDCCGIAPENIDKIFDPFFTTKAANRGTGLGLSIVQHIISQAGGKVRVKSKLGEGANFFVTLPINKNQGF